MTSGLEIALELLILFVAAFVAVITIVLARRLTRLFKRSAFDKPWKILLAVPIFMAGVIVAELSGIDILRVRALFALASSVTFLYCIWRFHLVWRTLSNPDA